MNSGTGNGPKVIFDRRGPVAHLILNRPAKLNALDWDCLDLLESGIVTAEGDDTVRAVVFSGQGRCFCAGADLGVVDDAASDPRRFEEFLRRWHRAFGAVEQCGKPTIAAVHGFALAGGFELTQVCDLLVLGSDASLGDQHANYGLFPGGGGTQRLPRAIPRRVAMRMLLTGEPVNAPTALAVGLASKVVPDEEVTDAAHEMALLLAERSPAASRAIKESVRRGASLALADALVVERSIAVEHMASTDAQLGLAAFRQGVRPNFGFRRDGPADR